MIFKEISIVIPTLNESKNLEELIEQINKVKKKLKIRKFEVIIIDDDSTDNTEVLLSELVKKFLFLKYFIRKSKKKDLSKSCVMGFKKAKYQNILVMDGDLQHPPKYIEHIVKKFFYGNFDIVVGNRNLLNKKDPGLNFFRYISSIIIMAVFNWLLGGKTSDPMSGFFLFKKKIYGKNKNKLFNRGYKILADLIYSTNENLKIADQTIYFDRRKSGNSKMNIYILLQLSIFILTKIINKVFISK